MNRFNYGKLVNGQLEYPPAEFHENGMSIVGFTEDFILQHGYKKSFSWMHPRKRAMSLRIHW